MDQTVMMTPTDLARALGVSRSMVYVLLRRGMLPAVRRGRSILCPKPAFEAWLKDQSRAALKALRTKQSNESSTKR